MKRALGNIFIVLFVAAFAALYVGFYFPDPSVFGSPSNAGLRQGLKLLKICLPIFALALLVVLILISRGKIALTNVILLLMGPLFAAVLAYFAAFHFYYLSGGKKDLREFHSYLQLKPRDHASIAATDPKPLQIFFIGGSTTAWPDSQGMDWESLVQDKLKAQFPSLPLLATNDGMEWYTTNHSLINYELNLRQYHPDILVVMHGINDLFINADFTDLSLGAFRPDYGHYLGPIARLINRKSFFENIAIKFRQSWYAKQKTLVTTDTFAGLPSFVRNLNTLVDLAKADGTTVVLMTEPFIYKSTMTPVERDRLSMLNYEAVSDDTQWTLQTGINGMQQYDDAVRDVAVKRQVPLVDLEKTVPKTLEYIRDDVHYTDQTFPLIADTVSAALAPLIVTRTSPHTDQQSIP